MGESLARGHVLVMSLGDDHEANMLWLDSNYPPGNSLTNAVRLASPVIREYGRANSAGQCIWFLPVVGLRRTPSGGGSWGLCFLGANIQEAHHCINIKVSTALQTATPRCPAAPEAPAPRTLASPLMSRPSRPNPQSTSATSSSAASTARTRRRII